MAATGGSPMTGPTTITATRREPLIVANDLVKTYELGGPQVVTFRELMQLILREIARERVLLPVPMSIAEIQAWFLEKLPVPPLTRDQLKLLSSDNIVSPQALTLRDLGIEPVAMEAVIPSYLDRYRPQAKQRVRLG